MTKSIRHWTIGLTMALVATSAFAEGSGMPGDGGRFMNGIFPENPPPRPAGAMAEPKAARAPAMELALQAVQAVAQGCKQYGLGVAVVNSEGAPILVYVPDGSTAGHGYTAIRKAYTAITFKTDTSALVVRGQKDAEFAAKVKADPNLMAFKGGLLLKAGDQIVGAIGVSGAEPGGHDEECGLMGLNKIKDKLK